VQQDFPFETGDPSVKKIITDVKYSWIIGSESILKYDKQNALLYALGFIRYPLKKDPVNLILLTDAASKDSIIYLTSHDGVFALFKGSGAVRRSDLPILDRAFNSIAIRGGLYFLASYGCVLQIDAATFERSFKEPAMLTQYMKGEIAVIQPYSYNDTIRIKDRQRDQRFEFKLQKELANHAVLKDFLYPGRCLKFEFNTTEIFPIGSFMLNQSTPIETTFRLRIPPEVLTNGNTNTNSLRVVDRKTGNAIKEWVVLFD
jgi:hypothetical protein